MRRLFSFLAVGLFLLSIGNAHAQFDPNAPVKLDPQVRYGKLENGLTYYIRHNEEPKERASFYIIQNVGAMLENDDQNGLAHFLEHMAFNGTKHFPGKGIINFLEKHGVAFGRNINAYTSFDETVYNLSNVPTTQASLLDSCLLVLNDWSNYLLLTDEEIDNERGVIHEEWRTRRVAGFRLFKKSQPYMFKGSKYAERDVIGSLDVIDNFKYNTIRDFYHDWYRTDLQAIAIVGDFDADEMETKVKNLFSKIPAVDNPKKREYYNIPDNEEPIFTVSTDPEATTSDISIMIKRDAVVPEAKNMDYLRSIYRNNLFNSMMGQRINELLQKENPPFISGSISNGGFMGRFKDAYSISTRCDSKNEATALTAIMTESERLRQHGFTQSELDRAKVNLLNSIETAYKRRDKRNHDSFCREFKSHYIDNDPAPGIEFELDFLKSILPTITLEEMNKLAPSYITPNNRVVIISGAEGEGVKHLSKEETFAIINKIENSKVEPYVDAAAGSSLLAEDALPASKLVSEKPIKELNAVEWTFANGVKVAYKFSELNKDQLMFTSFSRGGESQYKVEDLYSAGMTNNFIGTFGVGDFDAIALQKMLTGKNVSVSPKIGELTEGISGSCSPKDFETMMQLIYLYFENPRFDQTAFNALMQRYENFLKNMSNNPQKIMQDSLSMILTDHHERTLLMNNEYLKKVNMQTMEKIYKDRFQDASDFTFCFVGNIPVEEAKPVVEKYLGALTDKDRKEDWVDHHVDSPKGHTKKDIYLKLSVPKATVNISWSKKVPYSTEGKIYATILKQILDLRYIESVREKEGGTYGVGVSSSLSRYPEGEFGLFAKFDCDPEKADHLKTIIFKELNQIIENGPTQIDLDKAVKNLKKQRGESVQQNGFWLGALRSLYFDNENITAPENFENIVNNVTIKDIQKAANDFVKGANLVEITFRPKAE
ncbi:insulinase family protein [Puteibacter caeruleilacunae]|nr:insulinase family protein [Puteibacter caeruleilacunae]